MITEIGHFSLIFAFVLSLCQSFAPIYAARKSIDVIHNVTIRLAILIAIFVLISFSCLVWAFIVSDFSVALVAVGIGMLVGVPLGLLAAASRQSIWDEWIMRSNDLIFAFPSLVIAILITAIFGPSAVNAIIAIGIFNIPVFARVTRGAALSIWTLDFILSARIAGKKPFRISVEHILPNILSLLIVQGSIQFSLGILAEAGLSYVGLGVQPPTPSWGRMLADSQTMISFAPNLALFPGITIILAVLGLNLLGDGARDLLDPRLQDKIR